MSKKPINDRLAINKKSCLSYQENYTNSAHPPHAIYICANLNFDALHF